MHVGLQHWKRWHKSRQIHRYFLSRRKKNSKECWFCYYSQCFCHILSYFSGVDIRLHFYFHCSGNFSYSSKSTFKTALYCKYNIHTDTKKKRNIFALIHNCNCGKANSLDVLVSLHNLMLCRVLSLLWQIQRCCLLTFHELLYSYTFVLYYTSPWPLIRLPASLTTIEWQRQSTSNPLLLLPLLYPYLRQPVALCQRYTIRTLIHTYVHV